MARKFEDQQGPYEFEKPVHVSSKIGNAAYGVAGFAIAAAMLSGVAYAVNAAPENAPSANTVVDQNTDQVAPMAVETDAPADPAPTDAPADPTPSDAPVEPVAQPKPKVHHAETSAKPKEVAPPATVITPTFGSGDDEGDDNSDDGEDDGEFDD